MILPQQAKTGLAGGPVIGKAEAHRGGTETRRRAGVSLPDGGPALEHSLISGLPVRVHGVERKPNTRINLHAEVGFVLKPD